MSAHSTYSGVVVGVDGSVSSMMAVRWAARDAAMRNVALTVVHVASPPAVWPAAPIPAELQRRHGEDARKLIAAAIKIAEDSMADGNRPGIDSELLVAAPLPTLIDLTKDAQMMVVGCRGQEALQRSLGSVSTGLIHHAPMGNGSPRTSGG